MSGLDDLETKLGHRFADRALLTQALTHASAGAPVSNERFEFLGDRVLGLVIARALLDRFPKAAEGELAVRLNALVRKETCAEMAQASGIAPHIILSPGERQLAGRSRKAVLGDACEAVIAALYLDGGLEAAERFILSAWAEGLQSEMHAALDPKSELQVWALARADRALPSYRVLQSSGPAHAPHFVIEVSVPGAGAARGEGKSKREAEREAASALLAQVRQA
ncbi:MAG: ribonuclease III [Alphaproteobacteria bacterium]|nr:ribonuclease III [Alphaproteobacteria bacterium]